MRTSPVMVNGALELLCSELKKTSFLTRLVLNRNLALVGIIPYQILSLFFHKGRRTDGSDEKAQRSPAGD